MHCSEIIQDRYLDNIDYSDSEKRHNHDIHYVRTNHGEQAHNHGTFLPAHHMELVSKALLLVVEGFAFMATVTGTTICKR
jgi:hypothetical protein